MPRSLKAILALAVCAVFLAPFSAAYAKSVALVVGNANYGRGGTLVNTINDAQAFAAFLEESGYETTLVTNGSATTMLEAITAFADGLTPQDTAVFYFAGHGLQMNGENYLVGVGATLGTEQKAREETVRLGDIIAGIEAKAQAAIIFIDACRNNPLALDLAQRSEVVELGLAPFTVSGQGSLIAFAAGPGQVAYDGTSGNSPFTTALLARLGTPGVEVAAALKQVIVDVRGATGNRQTPQFISSLGTNIYFGGEPTPGQIAATPVLPAFDIAKIDYEKAKRVGTARVWQLFLEKHPGTYYAEIAQASLRTLLAEHPDEAVAATGMEENLGLDRATRTAVQAALADLGFDVGAADGVFGPVSRREIASYQKTRGLPSTGLVNSATLEALGIDFVPYRLGAVASSKARRYSAGDLAGLETDERLLFVVECLGKTLVNYGFFRGHLYVAVQTSSWYRSDTARREAERCSGHLVSIASAAENDFVFSLIARDPGYFQIDRDREGGYFIHGPIIGLKQEITEENPREGWYWLTGEPLTYTNWMPGQPGDDFRPVEETATFATHSTTDPRRRDLFLVDISTWQDQSAGGWMGYIIELD